MSTLKKPALESTHLVSQISDFLDQAKAVDIISIDLNEKSSIADFMLVASGTSGRHLKALAEKLKEFLHEQGIGDIHMEGHNTCDWVLIDVGDVIVHLFRPEIREFYNLEKMWSVDFNKLDTSENRA